MLNIEDAQIHSALEILRDVHGDNEPDRLMDAVEKSLNPGIRSYAEIAVRAHAWLTGGDVLTVDRYVAAVAKQTKSFHFIGE